MARLGINIDHIARIRQTRGTYYPDPVVAAAICELAGADGITVHLRQDRRHIQDTDLVRLKESVQTHLNLEMGLTDEMISIAEKVMPDAVCFVPERKEELTTEGGLDVVRFQDVLEDAILRLNEKRIRVSIFLEPDPFQIEAAKRVGAQCIEIHTGRYCELKGEKREKELQRIFEAASYTKKLELICHAGHGLDTMNIRALAKNSDICEFNIGHSIISRAVMIGLSKAVREMIQILRSP